MPVRSSRPMAKSLASRHRSFSVPSMFKGSPTSNNCGRQVAINLSIAIQSGSRRPCLTLGNGVAEPVTVCPLATPIFVVPKSNAMKLTLGALPEASFSSLGSFTCNQHAVAKTPGCVPEPGSGHQGVPSRLLPGAAPRDESRCQVRTRPHSISVPTAHRRAPAPLRDN